MFDANYGDDVDDQTSSNYTYDAIGNLIDDNQQEIDNIEWTIYGKIRKITRDAGSDKPDLEFRYDAFGDRICKIVKPKDGTTHLLLDQKEWTYTYYARDASGNVMAVYDRDLNASGANISDYMTLSEQSLYSFTRVGVRHPLNDAGTKIAVGGFTFIPGTVNGDGTFPISATVSTATASSQPSGMRWMTRKKYELSNHLGNVYSVVTDKKQGIATTQYATSVSYYTANVVSAVDYYAFGAPMSQRTFNSDYRYGFNGKENDAESGTQDYGFRIYNPALGKFLSVDPLTGRYPELTPYQFASNTPIRCIDLDGLEGSADLDVNDPNVQLMHKWAQEDGSGGTLLNNRYYNTFCAARAAAFAAGVVVTVAVIIAAPYIPLYAQQIAFWGTRAAISATSPSTIFFVGECVSFTANMLYDGPDDPAPTPGPGGEMAKVFKTWFLPIYDVGKVLANANVPVVKITAGFAENKIAVIGQGMDRVKQVKAAMVNAEIFTPSKAATDEWNALLLQWKDKGQIPADIVKNTTLYKENQTWINDKFAQGYTIVDLGADGSGTSSTFYNMELNVIYGPAVSPLPAPAANSR